jgi:aspartate aminotransferase-like enzyme
MESSSPLVFKIATEDWEFDLIHQLNYKTFVEEIPQHPTSASKRMVDRFHAENTYIICLSGRRLVGMLAARGKRPFSLDQKLADLDSYLPPGRALCEIRLLSVDKKFRTGQVFQGLMALMWQFFVDNNFDMGVISGTTRQKKLYHHLGFIPFGPLVGAEGAQFQPMYLSIESFEAGVRDFLTSRSAKNFVRPMVNFLPGPVAVSRHVRRAFEQIPESHRSMNFVADFQSVKQILCQLTGAKHVEILLGSGTLANDAIAAQLSMEAKPGLVLTNGEFGERLADHARRMGLSFDVLEHAWGKPFDMATLERKLKRKSRSGWLWCAHCETSTGMLNDVDALKTLCAAHDVKLCLDCISSIATTPVNLEGVYLASCASGKGLRSFPGLGMVFYSHDLKKAAGKVPRYLDLELYSRNQGVAFTQSSNMVHALYAALKKVEWSHRFVELREVSNWLRPKLREMGFDLLVPDEQASPAVVTLALPPELNSVRVGGQLQEAGFLLSCNSEYLVHRNWIQICVMGEFALEKLVSLLNHLNRICFRRGQTQPTNVSAQDSRAAAPSPKG